MAPSKFTVPVHEIKDGLRVEYDHIDGAEFEVKHPVIRKIDGIRARIEIHEAAIGIIADFQVSCNVTFSCVRCLEAFEIRHETTLSLNYISGADPHARAENVDLARTDINKTYYSGSLIDLTNGIREAILLFLPIAPLCKDDCAGICPVCGANRNRTKCACVIEKPGAFTPVTIRDIDRKSGKKKKRKVT